MTCAVCEFYHECKEDAVCEEMNFSCFDDELSSAYARAVVNLHKEGKLQ